MDEGRLLDLCHTLLEHARDAGADQAEAVAAWEHSTETHLENDDVHAVQSSDETLFGLRVLVGSSLGFVTTNDLDGKSIRASAEEAVAQARLTPPDDCNGLPSPVQVSPVAGLCDSRMADLDAEYTTRLAAEVLERVRGRDNRVRIDSGSVGVSLSAAALASTTGVAVSEASNLLHGQLFGMAVDGDEVASFDYDGEMTRDPQAFEVGLEEAADRFVAKCLAGLGAKPGDSFKGSVVLSPEAVAEFLLPTLTGAVCADAVRKDRSPLAGRLGEPIAARGFSLVDDATLPGGVASSAFDREGVPTSRRELVTDGVLATYLFNHYEARAAGSGAISTGHASGSASTLPSIGPSYLEIAAGDTPSDGLVAASEKAVFVSRFSGSTNPVTGDFSGVVKNGFLLSGGNRRPVKEVLIQGNVFDMLRRISAISSDRRLLGGTCLVPTVRVEDISITAG